MNRRQKIIVSVTGIFLVLLILVGLTYAYFLTQIQGNEESRSITVTTANLVLRYEDGNGVLTPAEKIKPDSDVKFLDSEGNVVNAKTFNVINDGNQTVEDYAVTLENVKITYASDSVLPDGTVVKAGDVTKFAYPEDFEITVTCRSSKGKRCNGRTMPFPETNDIILVNTIEIGETQSYTLTMKYKDSGIDQSADMNKSLTAKINIMDTISTVDLTGTVAHEAGDYVEVNSSKPIRSEITSAGEYKILGVEPDNHTISVKYKDENGDIQTRYTYPFSVVKGETVGVVGNEITINKDARTLTMNVTSSKININDLNIKPYNPYNEGTLAYNIINGTNFPLSELQIIISDLDNDGKVTELDKEIMVEYFTNTTVSTNKIGESFIYNGKTYIYGDINLDGKINNTDKMRLFLNLQNINYDSSIEVRTNIGVKSGERLLSKTEDYYGTSYYYRGNVKNNYVLFNNLCWRIVRIEGDGSVKLILAGTPTDNKCENLSDTDGFLKENGTLKSVTYGYQAEGESKRFDYLNNTQGEIDGKEGMYVALTNWYNTTFDTEEKQKNVKQDTLWCFGGKKGVGYDTETGEVIDTTGVPYLFAAGKRLVLTKTPSLLCKDNEEDKMYGSIGTLTADESVFAGVAEVIKNNQNIYLSEQGYNNYLTLTYSNYGINDAFFRVTSDYILNRVGVTAVGFVRPVISLQPNILLSGGTGNSSSPYIV